MAQLIKKKKEEKRKHKLIRRMTAHLPPKTLTREAVPTEVLITSALKVTESLPFSQKLTTISLFTQTSQDFINLSKTTMNIMPDFYNLYSSPATSKLNLLIFL